MHRRLLDLGSRLNFSDLAFASVLLALHSVIWPYRGIVHDATLYALQALNTARDGKFAHDLFFAFGSQDSFSIFSSVMGPLVSLLGLKNAFWLGYMASSALLFYAEVRLVRSLIDDRNLANLGLVALATVSLPYGARDAVQVLANHPKPWIGTKIGGISLRHPDHDRIHDRPRLENIDAL